MNILIAENDITSGKTLRDYLNLNGFNTTWKRNGLDAWKVFCIDIPDVCILNIILPGLNGFELASRIKEQSPSCPSIFFIG